MISSQTSPSTKAKILVGTPCYGGMCFVGYVASLIQAKEYLKTKDIQLETCFLTNESLIPRGRNTIVAKFMTDPTFTHLLFVDGDITFNHYCIERLVQHNKDLVGALYPKKGYSWEKLTDCKDLIDHEPFDEAAMSTIKAKMMSYTVNYTNDRQVVNGLLRVKHIGTGFFLVKREVLVKMMEHYTELKYDDDINILTEPENRWLYALFDCEVHTIGPKRHYLSEDYLFCKRWQDMGGEIFADVTIPLTHTGTHSFVGNYLKSIHFEPSAAQSTVTPLEEAATPVQQDDQADGPEMDIVPTTVPTPEVAPVAPVAPVVTKPAAPVPMQSVAVGRPKIEPKRLSPADIAKIKIL